MTNRIHDFLDGEISRSDLSEEELRELEAMERAVEGSVAPLRRSETPDVSAAVMGRIREMEGEAAARTADRSEGRSWIERAAEWIWAPRTVQLRPAWALAALAVIALGIGLLTPPQPAAVETDGARIASTAEASAEAADEPVVYVRFELDADQASSVRLAGSFSDWQPRIDLAERSPGHWSALVPLTPGVHDYAFVVDGEQWVADPEAIQVSDGFGGTNSRIALVPPEPDLNGRSS